MESTRFKAVIFDLDGVITDTAAVHSQAWKQMFDEYLHKRAARLGSLYEPFFHEQDYLPYVDGKPRYQGVVSFLESRHIKLPYGDPQDSPEQETVCGLGNRKNQLFNQLIAGGNVTVFPSSVTFIQKLLKHGIRLGVASSSKNCGPVLEAVGLLEFFDTRVDGVVSSELGLKGKPEPDIFITACQNLGVSAQQAVVVEDAVSGVQAGRNGNFGLVLGIARGENAAELKAHGADMVVSDLAEVDLPQIEAWFKTNQSG